jgi:hypothetical protein
LNTTAEISNKNLGILKGTIISAQESNKSWIPKNLPKGNNSGKNIQNEVL